MLLLFKATERINVHFKGRVLTNNGNKSLLVVVDQYSIISFIFPSCDCSKTTVMKCLTSLFSLVGMPAYVHCHHRVSLISKELGEFLTTKGVAAKKTAKYYKCEGNGQAERHNNMIWRTIIMRLLTFSCQLQTYTKCTMCGSRKYPSPPPTEGINFPGGRRVNLPTSPVGRGGGHDREIPDGSRDA